MAALNYNHAAPKSKGYNPYSINHNAAVHPQYTANRSPSYLNSPQACPRRLDKVTRSRNALIISVVIFIVLFIVFLAVLLVYLPKILPSKKQTEVKFQVISVKKDATYDADNLDNPATYSAIYLNTTLCGYLIEATKSVAMVVSCNVFKYEEATPGVKSTMNVTATLGENTEDKLFGELSTAIITNAVSDTNWEVTGTDVKLIPWGRSRAARHIIQWPAMLGFLFVLHKMV